MRWVLSCFSEKLDNVLNAAKECVGARDMISKYGGGYNAAIKNGWIKLLVYKDKG